MKSKVESTDQKINSLEDWAKKNLKNIEGGIEVILKELLYKISPHLHPRVIKSLAFDPKTTSLIININQKASSEFMDRIKADFNSFKPRKQNKSLEIQLPKADFETYVNTEFLPKNELQYIGVAREIKKVTDEFDYKIIEPKPTGRAIGVKLGNAYIKKMSFNEREVIDIFNYVILHNFLGTKAPQIDLIRDEQSQLWVSSQSLSQTYTKNEITKNKNFNTLLGLKLNDITQNIKSLGKIVLLSSILRLSDLHQNNLGFINSKSGHKYSIVDHAFSSFRYSKTPNFKLVKSWNDLCDMLEKDLFARKQTFILDKLFSKLQNQPESLKQAAYAIMQPFSENNLRAKSIFNVNKQGDFIFENKSQTFSETIDKAYNETISKFKTVLSDLSSQKLENTDLTLEERLKMHKDRIQAVGLELEQTVNLLKNKDKYPLHFALTHDDHKTAKTLVQDGADVNQLDNNGDTPLHLAVKNNQNSLVKLMLNSKHHSPKLYIRNKENQTAFHLALESSNLQIIASFIQADANVVDKQNCHEIFQLGLLYKEFNWINAALKQNTQYINEVDNNGYTALHLACSEFPQKIELIEYLLSKASRVNIKNNQGKSAFQSALDLLWKNDLGHDEEDWKVIKRLVEHGANVNEKDKFGDTALHLAIRNQNIDLIKYFISKGADLNIIGRDQTTLFDFLKSRADAIKDIDIEFLKSIGVFQQLSISQKFNLFKKDSSGSKLFELINAKNVYNFNDLKSSLIDSVVSEDTPEFISILNLTRKYQLLDENEIENIVTTKRSNYLQKLKNLSTPSFDDLSEFPTYESQDDFGPPPADFDQPSDSPSDFGPAPVFNFNFFPANSDYQENTNSSSFTPPTSSQTGQPLKNDILQLQEGLNTILAEHTNNTEKQTIQTKITELFNSAPDRLSIIESNFTELNALLLEYHQLSDDEKLQLSSGS